jgi:hypothetical protein
LNPNQARKKRQLVGKLRRLVNDPRTGSWLFGFAADLLCYRGQSPQDEAAAIVRTHTQFVIRDLRMMRATASGGGPRGAWFNIRVLAVAKRFGIPRHSTIHPLP